MTSSQLPPAGVCQPSPGANPPGVFYIRQALIAFGFVPAGQVVADLHQFAGFKQIKLNHNNLQ